jgi:alginate O-acetyltransferase complex protein AlgI
MLFNSHEYLFLFLPAALLIYGILGRLRLGLASKTWLVIASLFFYAWGNPGGLHVLVVSVLLNFSFGIALTSFEQHQATKRKILLALALACNISLLAYYKYADFFIGNLNQLVHTGIKLPHMLLPLGVSFFTFIQIAYLVDVYRGTAGERNLLNYSLFASFFPYLLAGPIVRYSEVTPQFKRVDNEVLNYRNLSTGLYLLWIGLFKKVVLADQFDEWASAGFDGASQLNFLYAWATSLAYTFQIYFDFSGYTDMAIGAALMFNIKLPINFNNPYRALDIQDFWRRWHITLSRFLREYIYIPLGGNRVREGHLYLNLLCTFLIGGLWHGAGWTFIFWGFLHGMAMVVHRIWKKTGWYLPAFAAWFLTFNFVNVAWVFFRARTWGDAVKVLSGMFGLNGFALPAEWATRLHFLSRHGVEFIPWNHIMQGSRDAWLWIMFAFPVCLFLKNSNQMAETSKPGWRSLLVTAAGVYAILNMFRMSEFLYFNF